MNSVKKILVVDNDRSILESIEMVLHYEGYKVFTATSYKTILPVLFDNKPDVILIDVMLCNEDGRVICKQIKENKKTAGITVILISACQLKLKDHKQFLADNVLHKPFEISHLLEMIN